jgi:hypothetical protein
MLANMHFNPPLRFGSEHPTPQEPLARRLLFLLASKGLAGQGPPPVVNGRRMTTVEMLKLAAYARAHGFLPPV